MKFDEIGLYNSILKTYNKFETQKKNPRSSDWFIYSEKRRELLGEINANLAEEYVLKSWDDFGKNKKKYRILIPLMLRKACQCCLSSFVGQGECSNVPTWVNISVGDYVYGTSHEMTAIERKLILESPGELELICNRHRSKLSFPTRFD